MVLPTRHHFTSFVGYHFLKARAAKLLKVWVCGRTLHKNTSLGQRVKGLSFNTQQIMALKLLTAHETRNLASSKLVRFEPTSNQVQPSTCTRAANPQNYCFGNNLCAVSECRRVANPQKVEYPNASKPRTHKQPSSTTYLHEGGESMVVSRIICASYLTADESRTNKKLSS